jgi:outer membrane lipoprotein SlyB
MGTKRQQKKTTAAVKASKHRHEREAEGGAAGAIAGASMGAIAGPPGVLAGAVIGGVVGAVAGAVLDRSSTERAARAGELDAEIGVSGGELGAPNLEHPPAKSGLYSAASTGTGSSTDASPAEGPIQAPDS